MIREINRKHPVKYITDKEKLFKKILASVSLIIITAIIIYASVKVKPIINLVYKQQNSLDYKVYLYPNNFYETEYLEKDMQYIAGLINYIDINFKYNFKINENINYEYKYYIESDLTLFEKSKPNNIIYEKKEKIISDVVEAKENINTLEINEKLTVNYEEYNALVKNFKSEYNISAESNLKLTLYIEINGKYREIDYPISKKNEIKMTIPINEQIINITSEYDKNTDNQTIEISKWGMVNNILLALSILSGLCAVIAIIKLVIFIFVLQSKKTIYQRSIEKILKNYDRVIAELKEMINLEQVKEIIEIVNFEELLDVSDRVGKPILFIETKIDKESWFVIKDGEELYRYIIG